MLQYETNAKFLASSLLGVISQRLVRRLCPQCRQPIETDPLVISERIAARLDGVTSRLYRAQGCSECFGDGFTSLTCVPEILTSNQELADAITTGASANMIEEVAKKNGMLTLAEAVAARVYRGETTPHEAHRAIPDPLLSALVGLARENDSFPP
jgi:type II secretory ATPase GspE/PulE/Tfp pilus assembly ATPase PilB-like protein